MMRNSLRILACAAAMCVATFAPVDRVRAAERPLVSAAEAIRLAVAQRVGPDAEVTVATIDVNVNGDAPVFRDARPDPAGRLGQPMRFTLLTDAGAAVPVTALVRVVASYVVVRQPIARGLVVSEDTVTAVRAELKGVPLSKLPQIADVIGVRSLRPLLAGDIVLKSFVASRRMVEPGDRVTVVALAGAVEVTAQFVAADGGSLGDTIRVRNPETKKYLRGRIVKAGRVEVINER